MNPLRPLLIAIQFLTCLPVRLNRPPTAREIGASLLCYPLVGLGIGLALLGLDWVLAGRSDLLSAALALTAWVILTGALHLDGLADTADAWLGGFGDRARTLAIMKDPRSGPAALVAVVLVLLLKVAALQIILARPDGSALLLAPLLGRVAPMLLFLTTPYVRPGGLGEALARHLPRRAAWVVVIVALAGAALVTGTAGERALAAAGLVFVALRAWMLKRLGGATGDTAGALVELTECAVLVALAY
ncbi:adenosylcobinamide-GDP ribazoletransferase [Methylomagnum sp.]